METGENNKTQSEISVKQDMETLINTRVKKKNVCLFLMLQGFISSRV